MGSTTFTYGQFSRLTSFTDVNSNSTSYAYDSRGNELTANFADGSQETTAFDPLGDPISFVNRNGQTTGYTYNSFRPDHQGDDSPTAATTITPTMATATY